MIEQQGGLLEGKKKKKQDKAFPFPSLL